MSEITVASSSIKLHLNPDTLGVSLDTETGNWKFLEAGKIVRKDGTVIPFSSAREIRHSVWKTGVGDGIRSRFAEFAGLTGFAFETIIWMEGSTGDLFFE